MLVGLDHPIGKYQKEYLDASALIYEIIRKITFFIIQSDST